MNSQVAAANVADTVTLQAMQRPEAAALILRDRVISFRQLATAVNTLALAFLDAGVEPGQTIGLSMAQTPLHVFALLALARIGAVSVPVHALIPVERRQLAAKRYGVAAIVSGRPEFRIEGVPFIHIGDIDLFSEAAPVTGFTTTVEMPFRIALSSGTSGDPKGVMFSHGYMIDRMRKTNYACTPLSRIMPMDLNFPIGFVFALGMLSVGGAVVFPHGDSPADLARQVSEKAVTHWLLSPAQAEGIARLLVDDRIHFPSLEHLRIVGSTPSKRLLDILRRRFSPNVFVPYGSTEMGVISIASPEILAHFPDSAGRICPWARVEIVDERGAVLPRGQSGSLRLQAEGMLDGYYQAPEHTARRFRDSWYYPGDRARIGEEGLLFIEGREDDVINVNGAKVNAHDIEAVFLSHPLVQDAAALTLIDDDGRDRLAVAFVAAGNIAPDELRAYAAERLGPLNPQQVIQLPSFPRNTNGKLMREQLAGQAYMKVRAGSDLH